MSRGKAAISSKEKKLGGSTDESINEKTPATSDMSGPKKGGDTGELRARDRKKKLRAFAGISRQE